MALACLWKVRPVLQQLRRTATACALTGTTVRPLEPRGVCVSHRQLATKSGKGKSKGQAAARVNINASLVEDVIDLKSLEQEMRLALDGLKEDFNMNLNIRTSPSAFNHIVVTTKDGKYPLSHLGQITQKSPRLIIINMSSFPESASAVVSALQQSQMNLNPELDGSVIRVPVPQVTREHRENLAKLAKQLTNKAKESLRKIRTRAVQEVKRAKDGVSEDTLKLIEKQIQQMTDDTAAEMDKQLTAKTKDLLE